MVLVGLKLKMNRQFHNPTPHLATHIDEKTTNFHLELYFNFFFVRGFSLNNLVLEDFVS